MEYMKSLRQQKGLSVQELAELCGVSSNMIWNYESGRREPPLAVLCKIADALDVSLDMLVRGKEKDRPEGRPIGEMLKMYDKLSSEELELILAVINASLADRRYKASRNQANQE